MPLCQATHSIGTTALPPSTHCQPFYHPAFQRWSVQPTRQIWTLSALIHTAICCQERFPTEFLHFRCFVIDFCFIFFLSVFFFAGLLSLLEIRSLEVLFCYLWCQSFSMSKLLATQPSQKVCFGPG
jgi:hypothetical protein